MAEPRFRPGSRARELAPLFVPSLGFRPRGTAGDHLGPGVGASLEFEDRRGYSPGDDLRHVDWRALARTDQLMVRVHREEVQPRLDVLVDASRSMAVEPEKAQAAVDLAALLAGAGQAAGFRVRLLGLGGQARRLELDELFAEGLAFLETAPLGAALHAARPSLAPGSLRFCLSDFLSEEPPGLASLAGGGGVALVQLLGPWEADPSLGGQAKLVDAESRQGQDLSLDPGLVASYKRRLGRLVDGLVDESRRLGMRFCQVVAGDELDDVARNQLLPAGLLEPV